MWMKDITAFRHGVLRRRAILAQPLRATPVFHVRLCSLPAPQLFFAAVWLADRCIHTARNVRRKPCPDAMTFLTLPRLSGSMETQYLTFADRKRPPQSYPARTD